MHESMEESARMSIGSLVEVHVVKGLQREVADEVLDEKGGHQSHWRSPCTKAKAFWRQSGQILAVELS